MLTYEQCWDKAFADVKCVFPEITKINITTEKNKRLKRTLGRTRSIIGPYTSHKISINANFAEVCLSKNEPNELIHTMVHELLHCLPNCNNHGVYWKFACAAMRFKGYDISRLHGQTEYSKQRRENIQYKYIIQCKKCNKIFHRQKKSKFVSDIEKGKQNWRCGCGATSFIILKEGNSIEF